MENKKDLKDIPKRVLKVMDIVAVEHVDEVLRHALALEDAAKFLPGPSASVDWRTTPVKPIVAGGEGEGERGERGERKPALNAEPSTDGREL
jgi:ATP-dependent Lon protease